MTGGKRVVIVEDDFLIGEYLRALCEDFGFEVAGQATDAGTAITMIQETKPSHILMDMRLRGLRDGVDVAAAIRQGLPGTRVIFVTGSNEASTIERINNDDPHRILIKPIDPDALREALA